ncbi:8-oxo-(d)GTP phosphatase [soil metagenome]
MSDPTIRAAGGVLWRDSPAGPQIALVHRPRYDDWSLPKGKRKAGEQLLVTAVREVQEETGHRPRLGAFLGQSSYPVTSSGRRSVKTVKYWAMAATGGRFEPTDEVDEMAWLAVEAATDRVRFPVDRTVLRAFAALPAPTSTLLVIRGAPSSRRADGLVPVLRALASDRLLSAPATDCQDTLAAYAAESGLAVDDRSPDDTDLARELLELAAAGQRVALCADADTVAWLVPALTEHGGLTSRPEPTIRKGGWCLMHVADGHLLSVEREDAA